MADFGDIGNNLILSGGQSVRRDVGDTGFEAFATPILNGKAEQYYGGDGAFHDIPTVVSAFLADTASDITGYKTLQTTLPAGSIANSAASITGAATVVKAFALAAGVFDFISGQVLHLHIHAAKTGGTKNANLYIKVYHRTSGGTETLMGTSDATASLPGSNTEFDLSVSVPDTAFSATDRFVVKYLSDPSGGGTDPTVTIYYQGNTNSRVEIGTNLTTSGATDANAVHVNVAGEIAAITAKATPVTGDYLIIEDSADANAKKSITIGTLPGSGTIGGTTGSTDNAVLRADGTGGATVQSSAATIDDSGTVNIPTGQTYNINSAPHTHAYTERSGATTDGHIAVWNGSSADSIKDGGALSPSGASTADPFVIGQGTASDLSAKIQISGLSASADINGAAGAGTAEEYDTSTTGLTWNNTPATVDSDTTVKSHLYIKNTADATERLGTKSWAPGAGAFDARCKLSGGADGYASTTTIGGLYIANSDDSVRILLQLTPNNTIFVQAYTYATGAYTQRGANQTAGSTTVYLRITRDGSNNIKFYWSTDGHAWQWIATQALTLTVAKIGYRLSGSVSGQAEIAVDWLRTSV